MSPKTKQQAETRSCPYCREEISAEASRCKHCQSPISPAAPDHGGTCPHCREEIHPQAVKCKHCGAVLPGERGDCRCEHPHPRGLAPPYGAPGRSISTEALAGAVATAQIQNPALRQRAPGIVIVLPPQEPMCYGRWVCVTICLPFIGCHSICHWECILV